MDRGRAGRQQQSLGRDWQRWSRLLLGGMSHLFNFAVPTLYSLFLVALFTFLLMRGITHTFVALFLAGSILHLAQTCGYMLLNHLPGGFGANQQYLPILAGAGVLGTIVFAAAFVSLAAFLLRAPNEGT
ncbi:MAG TPA: hypothetical protein VGC85_10485, partial [Chthoniobacterales bacterium]